MKKLITISLISTALVSCAGLGEKETNLLQGAAIKDARKASKEIHLEYLQCYALPEDYRKDDCVKDIRKNSQYLQGYSSWIYILAFEHEAEKLGFKKFLNSKGKKCSGITEGPIYNKEDKAYDVNCTDGRKYSMRYGYQSKKWKIVK